MFPRGAPTRHHRAACVHEKEGMFCLSAHLHGFSQPRKRRQRAQQHGHHLKTSVTREKMGVMSSDIFLAVKASYQAFLAQTTGIHKIIAKVPSSSTEHSRCAVLSEGPHSTPIAHWSEGGPVCWVEKPTSSTLTG
jgi:hypothetical protein